MHTQYKLSKHDTIQHSGFNVWHDHLHVFQVLKTKNNQPAKVEENYVSKSQMFSDNFQMPSLVWLVQKK